MPTLLRFLIDYGLGDVASLSLIRLEGDRATGADIELVRNTFPSQPLVVNGLGATECGLVRQYFIRPGDVVRPGPVPLGQPVVGMDVYVVHVDGEHVDAGAEGEVVVESRHMASTYWGDSALTKKRFRDQGDGIVRYHTGDIGRMSADGTLRLVGRSDDVVKVAGSTVHIGAVEAVILEHPGVTDARVWHETEGVDERLVAEVCCAAGGELDKRSIRSAILRCLPRAALPELRQVDELPATAAGKLSRMARRAPDR